MLVKNIFALFEKFRWRQNVPKKKPHLWRDAREVRLKRERLLRTMQEDYHPLQEVCPLDLVKLL